MTKVAEAKSNLIKLVDRRATIFATITSIFDAIKPLNVDNITKVQAYINRLPHYEDKYRKVQSEILELNQVVTKEDRIDVLAAESSFLDLVVEIESLYEKLKSKLDQPVSSPVSTAFTPSSFMLPKITLPSFSGKIEEWPDFISLFDSLVHFNTSLDHLLKFQYLRSTVKGEALSLISGFQVSQDNYLLAYQALVNRYQNKRRIASMYLNKILSFKSSNPHNSLANLRELLNVHQTSVNAIKALQIPDFADFLLFSLTLKNIDPALRKRFEDQNSSTNFPTFDQLIGFITKQVRNLELNSDTEKNNTSYHKLKLSTQALTVAISSPKPSSTSFCSFCKDKNHIIYKCDKFGLKSPRDKFYWIKEQKLCLNCLRHPAKYTCHSKITCTICRQPHHTLLHFGSSSATTNPNHVSAGHTNDLQPAVHQPVTTSGSAEATPPPSSCVAGVSALPGTQLTTTTILMATCLVKLQVSSFNSVIVRALLDSGAGASFISERCAQLLQCARSRTPIPVSGIGHSHSKTKGSCFLSTLTLEGKIVSENHPFLIMESLTNNTPQVQISSAVRTATNHLRLADPSFDSPSSIDCILGADIAAIALEGGSPVVLGPNFPTAIPSVFGYILMGSAPRNPDSALIATPVDSSLCSSVGSYYADPPSDLHSLLERFWSVEEPPKAITTPSPEDQICEDFFKKTTTLLPSGRYQVRLPFLPTSTITLGDSYNLAYARFTALERKFAANSEFKSQYCSFMDDYIQQGHMTLANGPMHYFIPHHGVFKSHGDTTKIRVVFNAASKTTTGPSLNDLLYAGPKLQPLLSDVITLFRQYLYVFVCDIRQMFRQIAIHPQDYPFQCILWRDDPSKPIKTYYLTTVTYGTRCAPYLALRTISQLVEDEGVNFPLASSTLKSNIFVDDIAVGASTLDQALLLRNEIIALLAKGSFFLRKWLSNHPDLLNDIPKDHLLESSTLVVQNFVPLLGTLWDPSEDFLTIPVDIKIPNIIITKRIALSYISKIFDPCGWLSPFTMKAKHFIQRLWRLPLDWDTPFSLEIQSNFLSLFEDCSSLSKCTVPRTFSTTGSNSYILHGFCDASEIGYAAVLYLQPVSCLEKPVLLMAKTRVAPLKRMSIPRLELCAAHLLASLLHHILELFGPSNIISVSHLWTDSQIVLSWLNIETFKLKTFVANRVSQIAQWTSNSTWHYVKSADNPADVASRGATTDELAGHNLWWHGPSWISDETSWPSSPSSCSKLISDPKVLELTPVLFSQPPLSATFNFDCFQNSKYISSWTRLIGVAKVILSWRCCLKNRKPVTFSEASIRVCYYIQRCAFSDEIKALSSNQPPSLRVKRLNPFLDSCGVIRVGGRLSHSNVVKSKHQILLPKSHPFVHFLIDHYHLTYFHSGLTFTQYHLSLNFWILSARQVIRSRIFHCIKCFRAAPVHNVPLMGELPSPRVNPSPPFFHTGMDFAGPFNVKASHLRKAPILKAYLCIFVCMSSKAVHLELSHDLTTTSFIDVLHRFISRRGCPSQLYSDCGTNFVGASVLLSKQLKAFFHNPEVSTLIHTFCDEKGISFNFNSPSAPHQGGLWERAVRSVKFHLTRMINNQVPTWANLNSLVIRIEGILNSRPLSPMSSLPTDLEALTPGHLLIGRPITAPPEPVVHPSLCSPVNTKWVQSMHQEFWKRWRVEYLPLLQPRQKWNQSYPNLAVGDLVVVDEANSPPSSWPLGRISAVHAGEDGVVRQAEVVTHTGKYLRPVVKLYKLPIDN